MKSSLLPPTSYPFSQSEMYRPWSGRVGVINHIPEEWRHQSWKKNISSLTSQKNEPTNPTLEEWWHNPVSCQLASVMTTSMDTVTRLLLRLKLSCRCMLSTQGLTEKVCHPAASNHTSFLGSMIAPNRNCWTETKVSQTITQSWLSFVWDTKCACSMSVHPAHWHPLRQGAHILDGFL